MAKKKQNENLEDLRKKAEHNLRNETTTIQQMSKEEVLKIVHELHVYQIELEMQNKTLREAQVELEMSRSNYTDLFDFAPIGYFVLGKKGNLIAANLTGASLFGIERDLLLKRPFDLCVSKESRDCFYMNRRQVFQTGTGRRCDIKMLRKGKGEFDAELIIAPILDPQNNVTACRIALIDITRRTQAEHQIVSLALFPSENPFPVLRLSGEGTILYSNTPGHVLLEQWGRQEGQKAPEDFCKLVSNTLRTKQYYVEEVVCGERIFSFAVTPVVDEGYVNLYGRDITLQKQTEKSLLMSREDLNHAQAVGNIGSWRMNVRKNQLTWSDENHHIFGVPKGKPMTYETFLSVVHPDDLAYVDKKWQEAQVGKPYDIEHRLLVDGQVKWVREKAYMEFDSKGELIGGFGITQDITERKQIERSLDEINLALGRQVQTRSAELAKTINSLQEAVIRRVQAEQSIEAERQRFNDVLETLPVYVCLMTRDYYMPFANQVFRDSFGYVPDKKCYEFLFNRQSPCETCETYSVFKTGQSHHWEWTGPNGKDYDIYDFPFKDTDGTDLILEMGIDVTERKRMEQFMRITNRFLELFVKKTSRKEYLDSVVELIRDWSGCRCVGIRLVNSERYIPYESCVGFDEDFQKKESHLYLEKNTCVCTRIVSERPDPQDGPMLTSRGSFCCENTFHFIDSLSEQEKERYRGHCLKVGFASLGVVPIRYRDKVIGAIHMADENENGVPREKVEFLEDMAALVGEAVHRFNVEGVVKESEQKFQMMAQASEDLFWINTPGIKKVIYVSPAYETLWCRSCRSLYEKPQSFLDAVHPEDCDALIAGLAGHADGKWDFEYRIVRPDGSIRWVHDRGYPIFDEHGKLYLMTGTIRDVTERVEAQQAILAQQKQLRSLTTQLQLAEERERRRIAQDLHDSIGPILAFSTRELKTLKSTASAPLAQTLGEISKHLDQAIQQTRSMSFDLSPSLLYDFGLEAAIEDLIERIAKKEKLRYSFKNCSAHKPLSDNVKVLLYRSVRELMINMLKHAHANQVDISLKRSGNDLHIRIEDNGQGFDSSFLTDHSKRAGGFGLFSIRERLSHIGGYMNIESQKDKGTTIMVVAPLDVDRKNVGDGL